MAFTALPQPNFVPALPNNVNDATPPSVAIMLVTAGNYAAGPGQMGTIASTREWRADRQRAMADHVNIQIQRNGVDPPSTVACLLVPRNLAQPSSVASAIPGRAETPENRFRELTHAIQIGLIRSHESLRFTGRGLDREVRVFQLGGTFST